MSKYWTLRGKKAVPVKNDDVMVWAKKFNTMDRTVANTKLGGVEVSTVFLGLNHQFLPTGKPLIFETIIFGGPLDQDCERYSTWEESEEGHKAMVAKVVARKEGDK